MMVPNVLYDNTYHLLLLLLLLLLFLTAHLYLIGLIITWKKKKK